MQVIKIGYSSCPNDTFIFDALVHEKVDTEGLKFKVILKDVEELNQMAFRGELEVTKLSYFALANLLKSYQLLNSGGALGSGVGPLLIARQHMTEEEINLGEIAIPGKYTTANFLLSLAYPKAQNKKEMLFSDIESAVLNGEVASGLIIHENRFTYQSKGLVKIKDLGNFWEETSGSLIPLGGIVIKRAIDQKLKEKVDRLIKKSIAFAFENRASSLPYVREHAQEMDEKVMQQHIDLYVNEYSLDLGEKGKAAVMLLFNMAEEKKLIKKIKVDIFV